MVVIRMIEMRRMAMQEEKLNDGRVPIKTIEGSSLLMIVTDGRCTKTNLAQNLVSNYSSLFTTATTATTTCLIHLPSRIISSAARRLATPACAMTFWRRSEDVREPPLPTPTSSVVRAPPLQLPLPLLLLPPRPPPRPLPPRYPPPLRRPRSSSSSPPPLWPPRPRELS